MSLRFAMVTDTHVGMTGASVERLRPVYAAIARRAPDFVLHCGDITDTGLPGEYERYWQTVPAALRGRIRHMPGNHEVRWDPTAKGLYREQFGAAPYSFDAGGVHVTGLDLTQPLLEPGHCGAAALEWLDRDLAAAGGPALLFQHFPVGGEHDYVDDQAALLELIARHDVRVLVAGHVHREAVTRLDGPVQVTLQAVLKEPVFYWAELGDSPALTVSRLTVAADGTQASSPVAAVPLTRPLTGSLTGPLTGPRRGYRPPRGAAAAGLPQPQWRLRLAGSVQAGIAVAGGAVAGGAAAGDVVVAASTSGDVAAVRVPADRGGRSVSWLWRARFGPVYRRPGVSRDGRTLFVPSADRHLYALDASTGLVGWRFAADAPVLSQPLVTPDLVVFTAGERLLAVHATSGELAWAVPGRGFSAGRAGCDGERVYTAAADGFARAHDLRTGREAWSHRMVSGDLHRVTLYSGWDDVIALGAGVVLAATVSGTQALEAATGAPRWTLPGSTMYPPTVVLGDGTALFATERGLLSRVGLADGGAVWQADLGVGVQNAGLAVAGDSAWVVTADGRLVRVRLADGREQGAVRYTLAQCFSAPAVTGDTLVAGDQGGVVHGLRLPTERGRLLGGAGNPARSGLNVGDPQAGVGLIPAVDGHQVGGQRLDLAAVAQAAGVDSAHAGDARRQGLHQVGGFAIVAEHQDVQVDRVDLGIEQQDRGDMVERRHHPAAGQQRGGLLGRTPLGDRQRVGAALVEAERVDAVHDDLARQLIGQRGQQVTVALPRHRGDYHAGAAGGVGVGQAQDAVPDLPRGGGGALGASGPDDHLVPGQRESAGQAASLVPGAAEDADDESVHGRGFALSHALHPSSPGSPWGPPGGTGGGEPPVKQGGSGGDRPPETTLRTDMAARRGLPDAP